MMVVGVCWVIVMTVTCQQASVERIQEGVREKALHNKIMEKVRGECWMEHSIHLCFICRK